VVRKDFITKGSIQLEIYNQKISDTKSPAYQNIGLAKSKVCGLENVQAQVVNLWYVSSFQHRVLLEKNAYEDTI